MIVLLFPTGSDHDRHRLPLATLSLIAVNILIYFVVNFLNSDQILRQYGFVAAHPAPHQFLTHMFLHAPWPRQAGVDWTAYAISFLHIAGNMVYLWFAGSDLEDAFGVAKFLALYFLAGLASVLLFWVTAVAGHFPDLNEPCVGASGAISGLLGLYLVRFPRYKIRMWFGAFVPIPFIMRQGIARISSLVFIGLWIATQVGCGIAALRFGGSSVAYWGHIGGFALGLIVGLATRQWRHGQQEYLLKEADHLFYKQKWYPAMELYQRAANRDPRCTAAFTKWALCWECTGLFARAEKVLRDALHLYQQKGWTAEAAIIKDELHSLLAKNQTTATPATAPVAPQHPNLLFRRHLNQPKGHRHD